MNIPTISLILLSLVIIGLLWRVLNRMLFYTLRIMESIESLRVVLGDVLTEIQDANAPLTDEDLADYPVFGLPPKICMICGKQMELKDNLFRCETCNTVERIQ